ncbi:MAG: DNA-processing protein DprA, partial [Alphaproteobacteria bacterium]|nr:DNA-processing protein DprA [Alphaproteobacteria bacterium]
MMQKQKLTDSELINWIRLAGTERIGPITFCNLINKFKTADSVFKALPSFERRGLQKPLKIPSEQSVIEELKKLKAIGGRCIPLCDEDYPEMLYNTEDAPPVIYVLGNEELLHRKCVAIVGTRHASTNGIGMAKTLASDLGKHKFVTVSGFAMGIDTAVHEASIETGTIAVFAGGVDVVYPASNNKLYEVMKTKGCVVSEIPLGTEPIKSSFPRRNRIISGLSLGVAVVEANRKSGSLITANKALEQGREVFAVPGFPRDPRASGTNELIRQGAHITEGVQDIIVGLQSKPFDLFQRNESFFEDDSIPSIIESVDDDTVLKAREVILSKMSYSPVDIDELG